MDLADAKEKVLHVIIWVLRTSASATTRPTARLPTDLRHRHLQWWAEQDTCPRMLGVFWGLEDRETLNLSACFINGNFVMIKSESIGKAKQTKGRELMPVAGEVVSYPPARGECFAARGALIEETIGAFFALEDPSVGR